MLSFFRKGGGGQVIVAAVAFAVIIVFVLEFRPGREGRSGITRECAVKIADSCIDKKEYWAAYNLIVPRELPQKKVKSMGLRKTVMDMSLYDQRANKPDVLPRGYRALPSSLS